MLELRLMDKYLNLLKRDKVIYVLVLSLIITVLIINNTLQFIEVVKQNIMLFLFSLIVFYFMVIISIKGGVWKNGGV